MRKREREREREREIARCIERERCIVGEKEMNSGRFIYNERGRDREGVRLQFVCSPLTGI